MLFVVMQALGFRVHGLLCFYLGGIKVLGAKAYCALFATLQCMTGIGKNNSFGFDSAKHPP